MISAQKLSANRSIESFDIPPKTRTIVKGLPNINYGILRIAGAVALHGSLRLSCVNGESGAKLGLPSPLWTQVYLLAKFSFKAFQW